MTWVRERPDRWTSGDYQIIRSTSVYWLYLPDDTVLNYETRAAAKRAALEHLKKQMPKLKTIEERWNIFVKAVGFPTDNPEMQSALRTVFYAGWTDALHTMTGEVSLLPDDDAERALCDFHAECNAFAKKLKE